MKSNELRRAVFATALAVGLCAASRVGEAESPDDDGPLPAAAARDERSRDTLSAHVAYSNMRRASSASGVRLGVGYERLVAAHVGIGGRLGIARHAQDMASSTLPYVGVHGFWRRPLGQSSQLKAGGAIELWVNDASETGVRGEPLFLHLLAEVAPQFPGRVWTVEVPLEVGVMPYFDPKVFTLQLGVRIGRSL